MVKRHVWDDSLGDCRQQTSDVEKLASCLKETPVTKAIDDLIEKEQVMSDNANGKPMVVKKTWEEFRESKLLWWVNRSLHLFGWAICCDVELDGPDKGKVTNVYPARVRFRGFPETSEEANFPVLTQHLKDNIDGLIEEANE